MLYPSGVSRFARSCPGIRRLAHRNSRSGFTLVELVVATTFLLIGLLAISSTTWRVHALRSHTTEHRIANNRMRLVVEHVRSLSAQARQDPDTWTATVVGALSAGGNPGSAFDAPGLTAPDGAARVGSIQIVTDETATDADLGEQLGMPRDLDGDDIADDVDVSATAKLLPVILRIQWTGKSGTREITHSMHVLGF